ncbi:MAG: hypothetical protein HYW34_04085 [Candidatus Brennerbacteria bacterium]|nr:hypothetical protein [Candidatus Brennerbacteria bacterium]
MDGFKKILFINLGIFLAAVLLLGGLLFAVSLDLNKQKGKIVEKQLEIGQRVGAFSVLASLQQKSEEAQRYSSALNNVLPKYEQLFEISEELKLAAKDRKLGFGFSFTGEQQGSEDSAGSANFNLNIQGKEADVLEFINFIENGRFLFNLANIDISRSGDSAALSASGKVSFQ